MVWFAAYQAEAPQVEAKERWASMQSERDFQRQWNTMKQLIGAEAQGKRPQAINSTRTLFGIKSHVEEVMDAIAAEDLARAKERIKQERIAWERQHDAQHAALHANGAFPADDAGEVGATNSSERSQTFTRNRCS